MDSTSNYRDDVSEEDQEEDVRLKAFALLNKIGPDKDDDKTAWPERPPPQDQLSSYQNPEFVSANDSHSRPPIRIHSSSTDQAYEEWGIAGLMVSCIADACKKSTEYAARRGYESMNSGEASGNFEKVSILKSYSMPGEVNKSNARREQQSSGRSLVVWRKIIFFGKWENNIRLNIHGAGVSLIELPCIGNISRVREGISFARHNQKPRIFPSQSSWIYRRSWDVKTKSTIEHSVFFPSQSALG